MRKLFLPVLMLVALVVSVPMAFASTKTVKVDDNFFSPKTLSVKAGTTVKWKWAGSAPHNVTVRSGPVKFASKNKTSGAYVKKLTKKGTYSYVCTIHSGMNGKIKVS